MFHLLTHGSEIKSSVHYTNKRMLKDAKQEIVSKQQRTHTSNLDNTLVDLFEFTKSFGAYAREVLPSVRSERHRSSKYTSPSTSRSTLEQARPKIQHPGNYGSMAMPYQPPGLRILRPAAGHPATSNISTGSHSSNSMHSRTKSDSTSSQSSPSRPTSRDTSTRSNIRNLKHVTNGYIEPQDMKAREYMNNPNGNILSHPKVKSRTTKSIPPLKTRHIGRHTIGLDATHLYIDNHSLSFEIYATADQLYEVLSENKDKLDALVEALDMEQSGEVWDGIPGWVVAHGVTMEASVSGTDDEG
jgi:hypothetical protein